MLKENCFDKDLLVDWRREAAEEIKTKRFCPNCVQLVSLKLLEHKYYQNFYVCTKCGEMILKKGTIRFNGGYGYSYRNYLRFEAQKKQHS